MSNLKKFRKQNGFTQDQLSLYSGVSYRAITGYEQGEMNINKINATNLYRLAKSLNCSMEDLLEDKEKLTK